MPTIPATTDSTSIRLDFSSTPLLTDPTFPQGFPGPAIKLPFALDIRATDSVFLRTLYPLNSEFDFGGTASNDGFKFGTFPDFRNRAPGTPIPVLDINGLALQFSTLRAIAIIVQPIIPYASGAATGLLTSNNTNLTDGLTITVGTVTYTAKTTLGATAGQVKIGGSADATLLNLVRAINYTGTPGTDYIGTVKNPDVSAAVGADHTVILTARVAGTAGNSLALSTTAGILLVASTTGTYPQPATTLTNGTAIAVPQTARPFDGSVSITLADEFLPASSTADANWQTTKPAVFIFASPDPWTPGASAKLDIQFTTSLPSPALNQDVNAQVTVLLVGTR